MAISAPGDTVLVPNPSYPMHAFGFVIAGANVRSVPIGPGFDFFAGLDRAYRPSVPSPIALIVSFPANPTAMTVDLAFYEAIVDFAKKRNIWVISALPYTERTEEHTTDLHPIMRISYAVF